jgi:hypothetical protein
MTNNARLNNIIYEITTCAHNHVHPLVLALCMHLLIARVSPISPQNNSGSCAEESRLTISGYKPCLCDPFSCYINWNAHKCTFMKVSCESLMQLLLLSVFYKERKKIVYANKSKIIFFIYFIKSMSLSRKSLNLSRAWN